LTSSPNAGHPMSAAAGLLGVVLEKHNHYRLGEGQSIPEIDSIEAVNSLMVRTAAAATLVAMLFQIGRILLHRGIVT